MAFETTQVNAAMAAPAAARRAALFRESPLAAAERWMVTAGWSLMPKRIGGMPQSVVGFREIPRREFLMRLDEAARRTGRPGRWTVETDAAKIADRQPQG